MSRETAIAIVTIKVVQVPVNKFFKRVLKKIWILKLSWNLMHGIGMNRRNPTVMVLV